MPVRIKVFVNDYSPLDDVFVLFAIILYVAVFAPSIR